MATNSDIVAGPSHRAIYNWSCKRSGATITINGVNHLGLPVRISGVMEIRTTCETVQRQLPSLQWVVAVTATDSFFLEAGPVPNRTEAAA